MSRLLFPLLAGLLLVGCDALFEGDGVPTGLATTASPELDTSAVAFSWAAVEGITRYDLEVVRDRAGVRDTILAYLYEPRFSRVLGPGAYQWRVRTLRDGEAEPWSETARFSIDRLTLPISFSWFLSTSGLEPNHEYRDDQLNPYGLYSIASVSRELEKRGLTLGETDSLVLAEVEARYSTPGGVELSVFEHYQVFVDPAEPVAELADPPSAPTAVVSVLRSRLPDEVHQAQSGVQYRLQVRTGPVVPPAGVYTFQMDGHAVVRFDIRGPGA